jgi:tRNA modification GTPase
VTDTDTAGLRPTDDAVEQAGKDLGLGLARSARVGLYVVDGSIPWQPDAEAGAVLDALPRDRVLAVVTKADLPPADPDPRRPCGDWGLPRYGSAPRPARGWRLC